MATELLIPAGLLALSLAGLALGALGRVWIRLDLLSHFRRQLLGVALSAVAALLVRPHAVAVLAGGVALTCLLPAGLGAVRRRPRRGAGRPGALKLVSLNLWRKNADVARVTAFLRQEAAEFVLLYELFPVHDGLLAGLADLYPWQITCAHEKDCGVALLSRMPWRRAETQARGPARPRLVRAEFARGGARLTVVGAHLSKPTDRPHQQLAEARAVAAMARALPGPVVLAGDLNATPWSEAYRALGEGSNLIAAGPAQPSWPVAPLPLPQLAIDHVLVSPEVRVSGVALGPRVGSDHLPVVALFEVP